MFTSIYLLLDRFDQTSAAPRHLQTYTRTQVRVRVHTRKQADIQNQEYERTKHTPKRRVSFRAMRGSTFTKRFS